MAELDNLIKMVEHITKGRLERYARIPQIAVNSLKNSDNYRFDHWVVMNDIKSKVVEIRLRLHFITGCAKYLARKGLDLEGEISSLVAHEFMKEYANLSSGAIEQQLIYAGIEAAEFDLNVEIPKEIPAYDEIDFVVEQENGLIDKIWKFSFENQELVVAIKILVKDQTKLAIINKIDPDNLIALNEQIVDFL